MKISNPKLWNPLRKFVIEWGNDSIREIKIKKINKEIPKLALIILYEESLKLYAKKRYGSKRIRKLLIRKYGIAPSDRTIRKWIHSNSNPVNRIRVPLNKPTDFSYVLGVLVGDGWKSIFISNKRKVHGLGLDVKDFDFIDRFASSLGRLLGRKVPIHICKDGNHVCSTSNIILVKLAKMNVNNLKPFIEKNKDTATAFIQGFFDSEGCIFLPKTGMYSRITFHNTKIELLEYVKGLLLNYHGIKCNKINLDRVATDKWKNYYSFSIKSNYRQLFCEIIGATIRRKHIRMSKILDKNIENMFSEEEIGLALGKFR